MAILGVMKPAILLCLLLLAVPAYARLGETSEQIEARYGKPIKATKPEGPATDAEVYEKNGFQITVGYHEGKSYYEEFRKPDPQKPNDLLELTETERDLLAKVNDLVGYSGHAALKYASRFGDGRSEAVYANRVFTIRSLRVENQNEADEKKREADNLKEF